MSAIDDVFAKCAAEGRAAFIPFLMAGDPDLDATAAFLDALAAGGADVIELGVPFSDPIADGPTNQRATRLCASRASRAGSEQEPAQTRTISARTSVATEYVGGAPRPAV